MSSDSTETRFLWVTFILVITLGFELKGQYMGALNWVAITDSVHADAGGAKDLQRAPASIDFEPSVPVGPPQFSEVEVEIPCSLKNETRTVVGQFVRLKGLVCPRLSSKLVVNQNGTNAVDYFYIPEVRKYVTDVLFLHVGTNRISFFDPNGQEVYRLDMVRNEQ